MRTLKSLLGICEHDWKTIATYVVTRTWICYQQVLPEQVATDYHQECLNVKDEKYRL